MQISVAIVTKDEEDRLPKCLESVRFAHDIVVVDSGSRDGTVGVAEAFGCRVFQENWQGYGPQKQRAVDHCTHDWVLILDADERVPADTAQGMKRALDTVASEVSAFSFLRKSFFHDRWVRRCGWWPDRVTRLVRRGHGRFNGRLVHEEWSPQGKVMALDLVLEHYSFRNYSGLMEKMDSYSTLATEDMLRKGKRPGPLDPLSHGLWMFFRSYLLDRGFLEGLDGFMISLANAGGSFLKYAKLRERLQYGTPSAKDPSW